MRRLSVLLQVVLAASAASSQSAAAERYFALAPGVAESYVHRQWTSNEGLPVNTLSSLLLSPDGTLWIGTSDGLMHFDGLEFRRFESATTPELGSNRIVQLLEDGDGGFWIRTEQGYLARHSAGRFEAVDVAQLTSLSGRPIGQAIIASGELVLATRGGVYAVRKDDLVARRVSTHSQPIQTIVATPDGRVWAGGQQHLAAIDLRGRKETHPVWNGPIPRIVGIAVDDERRAWVSTDRGLYRETTPMHFEPADGLGPAWIQNPDGEMPQGLLAWGPDRALWLKMRGLTRIAGSQMRVVRRRAEPALNRILEIANPGDVWWMHEGETLLRSGQRFLDATPEAGAITSIAADPNGTVWLATARSGLHVFRPARVQTFGEREGLPERNVYPLLEDRDGALWVGLASFGLARIRDGLVDATGAQLGVDERVVQALHLDRHGQVVIGTGRRVVVWDGTRMQTLTGYQPPPFTQVLALADTGDGRLLVGTNRGLWIRQGATWRRLGVQDGLPNDVIQAIVADEADGSVWIGTDGGGLVQLHRDGSMRRLDASSGLGSNLVRSLTLGTGRILWIGTQDRGLSRLDLGSGAIANISTDEGLFDNGIHAVVEDRGERLWLSSNRGIARVDLVELDAFLRGDVERISCVVYDTFDGMLDREANGGAQRTGIQLRDGRLAFATQNGIAFVPQGERERQRRAPRPNISAVRVGGLAVAVHGSAVELGPRQRTVSFDFSASAVRSPTWVEFRHRLVGVDESWTVTKQRTATFIRLPAGRYRFEVAARDADGVWSSEPARLDLTLAPRLQETGLFRAMLVVLAVAGLVGLDRLLDRRRAAQRRALEALVRDRTEELERERDVADSARSLVEQQARRLEHLDRLKSELYANLSHELRTPLTMTLSAVQDARQIGAEHPSRLERDLDIAERGARTLIERIGELLELARAEAAPPSVRPTQLELRRVFEEMLRDFGPWAERAGIDLVGRAEQCPTVARLDHNVFEMVLQNLVSNALKFSPRGSQVLVTLERNGARLGLRVRDHGPGIAPHDQPRIFDRFWRADDERVRREPGTGLGLPLARDLIRLHGGDLTLVSSGPDGSELHADFGADWTVDGLPNDPRSDADAREGSGVGPDIEVPAQPAFDRATVLIVDDHPDLRTLLRQQLESHYRVLEAADGVAALALTRRECPDVVLSDVMMPELDGAAFCRELRADPAIDATCVILVSARADRSDVRAGLAAGADDYLVKPFDAIELRLRIGNQISARRRLAQRLLAEQKNDPSPTPVPAGPAAPEDSLARRLEHAIDASLSDPDFGVDALARAVAMDRTTLYRHLSERQLPPPSQLLRTRRMVRAKALLDDGAGVAQAAYAVGFRSVSHFSKAFQTEFGERPSRHAQR